MQDAIILYENGKAIGGEGHPTNASDITFDNTGTNLVSENVEGAIKEVNAKTSGLTRMTKLWENLSPTASFVAQNITLSSSDYDFMTVNFSVSVGFSTKIYKSVTVQKGQNIILDVGRLNYQRSINYTSDTSYNVGSGSDANATNDNICVPIAIYGIKII